MQISKRAKNMSASPIRKLVPFADDAKKRGVYVYHVNIGQPDIKTPSAYLRTMKKFDEDVIAYDTAQGNGDFREGLASYYQSFGIKKARAKHFQVTTGGSEAILFAMASIANPGDEIIVFEPFYANYNGIANMLGIKLVPVTLYAEDSYHIKSREDIEDAISLKTRAILICNPNNPTGTVYTAQELKMLIEIANKHDLFVIADEVYREFVYTGKKPSSILSLDDKEHRIIVVDSLSKRFSLCGARIGYLITFNEDVLTAVLRMGQARLCPPTIPQIASTKLLYLGQRYYEKIVNEYNSRRQVILDAFCHFGNVVCNEPRGAFYLFVKLPVKDTDHFAKWLLTDFQYKGATTMVAPGTGFYASKGKGKQEIRIAYVLKKSILKKAMKTLTVGLQEYLKMYS